MAFASRSEALTHMIWVLTQIQTKHSSQCSDELVISVSDTITQLQIAFENHVQDIQPSLALFKNICETLSKAKIFDTHDQAITSTIISDIEKNTFIQSAEVKFANPLARRAESELPILLLLKPTKAMMAAVAQVSKRIIQLLEDMEYDQSPLLMLLEKPNKHVTLGVITPTPTISQIKQVLAENDPARLPEIMYLHYQISLNIVRDSPIKGTPDHMPIGDTAALLQKVWHKTENIRDFYGPLGIGNPGKYGDACRGFIPNTAFYSSALYLSKEDDTRGRQGTLRDDTSCNQLGLMLTEQSKYAQGLPTHPSSWVPDVKGQSANFQSQHVIDQIQNDGVYVSGYSGMTSLLLGQMELLNNFDQMSLKQHYLTAVAAYIVGGGFHSLHEVIGPAEYVLGLVPNYKIQPPDTKDGKIAPPPNYYQFFEQQMLIDPEFAERRKIAWQQYLTFYEKVYLPLHQQPMNGKQEIPDIEFPQSKAVSGDLKIIDTQEPKNTNEIPVSPDLSKHKKDSVIDNIKFSYEVARNRLNISIDQSSHSACNALAADILVTIDKISTHKNISIPTLKCLVNCLNATSELLNNIGAKRAEMHILVETYLLLLQEIDNNVKDITISARKERCVKVLDDMSRFSQGQHSILLSNIIYHGTKGICVILDKTVQPFDSRIKQKMLKFAALVSATQQVEPSLKKK